MSEKLKEVILLTGEEILFQIEGNAYTASPNPMVKIFASITRVIGKILGWTVRKYIVITNKRLIVVQKEKTFWVFPRSVEVKTIAKSAIREVGYAQETRWFFVKTMYFQMQTITENTSIVYKGSLNEINDIVIKVAELISL